MALLKFSVPLRKIAEAMLEDVERGARAIAFEVFQRIIYRTPVDKGRARGNWQLSLESPIRSADLERFDKVGGDTVAEGAGRIANFKAGMTIHIRNNVNYIFPLERGHSQQAPTGMVRITLLELPQITRDVTQAIRAQQKRI